MKICGNCGVNPISEEYKEQEMCLECLESQDEAVYSGELNFDKPDHRRDDRMLPEPVDQEFIDKAKATYDKFVEEDDGPIPVQFPLGDPISVLDDLFDEDREDNPFDDGGGYEDDL